MPQIRCTARTRRNISTQWLRGNRIAIGLSRRETELDVWQPARGEIEFQRAYFLSASNPHKIEAMLRDSEFARRSETGIQIRPGAVRLRWELTDLATADGHLRRELLPAARLRAARAEPIENAG